ncbi:MAG TPA: hypothetical protein VFF52_02150 [Isosphaeraceae bacterium]|jgi:hypothetical protein|nr:hypothetical protein [Isosphaeraceae bacterium]
MQTETVVSTDSDPLRAVADAMDAAVQAVKDGAEHARTTATDALPAASQFLSQAIYKTSYTVSFGVVFPAMLVAHWFPKNNAVAHGLIDGAHAAMDLIDEMKSKSASSGTL